MNPRWLSLLGITMLLVLLLRDSLTDICREEIRTRFSRLPYTLLRLVALRLPRGSRQETVEEWRAELAYILRDTEGLPLTRLLRGVRYSSSLLRLLVPTAPLADLIARYALRRQLIREQRAKRIFQSRPVSWVRAYLRHAAVADFSASLAGGLLAFEIRFGSWVAAGPYLVFSLALPVVWLIAVSLAGGYDARFIGVGSDEFRRIVNAGVSLTAAVAIVAYATEADLARGYVVVALPCAMLFDILARYGLRKRLHKLRYLGSYMRRVVVVGEPRVAAHLIAELRRESYHGLLVVGACLTGRPGRDAIAGVPVLGGIQDVATAVAEVDADTVAVLACPEMSGARLRELAWDLEKTNTDLCVAPALLDVAGPRTSIRPVAGLPLLHVDYPDFIGVRRFVKTVFDRAFAASAIMLLSPLLLTVALVIRCSDGGPVFFRQVRLGKDGRSFVSFKFRTVVPDAEQPRNQFATLNDHDGALFKVRNDPRVTPVGRWLRRWSLDELPQLLNVLVGDMSLVGPRPALPKEAALYADHVRRRLMVKPGLTGLWQVNGRSDLSWEESVRLDLRYVENWSFVLDLQILWKTWTSAMQHNDTVPFAPDAASGD